MFKKKHLNGMRLYGEMHVFLVGILHMRGAKISEVEVTHHERTQGTSKHTFIKGAKDIADLLTVKFILGTSRPLLVFMVSSLLSWSIALITAATSITLKIMHVRNFGETPLPVITSLFIIVGFLFIMMGFLAELMLRIYYESKRETPYVISNIKENK